MKKFLLDILIDPLSEKPLLHNETENTLHTGDYKHSYKILNEVPLVLLNDSSFVTSALHQNFSTSFDYASHYQKDAEVHDYFQGEKNLTTKNELRRLHEVIINRVPLNAGLILDCGCGSGWLANHFLSKNRKVISMDISTVNPVKALKKNTSENHAGLVADAFNLPIKKNSIDCIIASEIMEHVHDPKLFINKLVEVLKPSGKLIITTPYDEKIEYYLCVHCNLPTPKNAHLHSFNKQNIQNIIPGNVLKWSAKSFANKYLIRSRIDLLLSFLPYPLWKIFDSLINKIFPSPTRFIIEIIKE